MKPYLLIALFALACSPQARLNRLIKKHPELVRADTLVVHDTIHIAADTLIRWKTWEITTFDTVVIENERQVVKWRRVPVGTPCDSCALVIEMLAAAKADTITTEVKVPCPSVQATKEVKYIPWWIYACMGALFAACAYFAIRRR